MFQEITRTAFPPKGRPVMVWDGSCKFCRYWIAVWEGKTGGNISYETYQNAGKRFRDIPTMEFARAVRLIEQNGDVYGGPDAAYRSMMYYQQPTSMWHKLYRHTRFFRLISDYGYKIITDNRSLMFSLTKLMFGSNPRNRRPYWIGYLFVLVVALLILTFS